MLEIRFIFKERANKIYFQRKSYGIPDNCHCLLLGWHLATNLYKHAKPLISCLEATRSGLTGSKFKKFSGGACPQTPLARACYARPSFCESIVAWPDHSKFAHSGPVWGKHSRVISLLKNEMSFVGLHYKEIHTSWLLPTNIFISKDPSAMTPIIFPRSKIITKQISLNASSRQQIPNYIQQLRVEIYRPMVVELRI